MAKIDTFQFIKGHEFFNGQYEVKVLGSGKWANKKIYVGVRNEDELNKKLNKFKRTIGHNSKRIKNDIIESFQTLKFLLNHLMLSFKAYVEKYPRMSKQNLKREFGKDYTQNVGNLIRDLTYDHEKLYNLEKQKKSNWVRYHKNIYFLGKELGELAMKMIGEFDKNSNFFKKRARDKLIRSYSLKTKKYESRMNREIKSVEVEMRKFL